MAFSGADPFSVTPPSYGGPAPTRVQNFWPPVRPDAPASVTPPVYDAWTMSEAQSYVPVYAAGAPDLILPPGIGPGSVPQALPPGASTFQWNPTRGEAVLALFASGGAGGASLVLASDDFRQALVSALFHAESMAAAHGLAVPIPATDASGNPVQGFVVGGALANAQAHPENPASRPYLEMLAAVDAALKASGPARVDAVITLSPDGIVTPAALSIAVLVVLAVIGVAAVAAVAYVSATKVEADANALARVQRAQVAADLVAKGLPVPPGLIPEEPAPSGGTASGIGTGLTLGLVAAGGVGLYFLLRK